MNHTILIVADESWVALDLKRKLEQGGYTVPAIATNVAEAFRGTERFQPCLLVMDGSLAATDHLQRRYRVPVLLLESIEKPFEACNLRGQVEIALWKYRIEEQLRASEGWVTGTVRSTSEALILTGSEGRVDFLNAAAERLTGWALDEAQGQPLGDVFQAFDESSGEPLNRVAPAARALQLLRRGGAESLVVEAEITASNGGVSIAFRDVTAKRIAVLRRSQMQKVEALAALAREVASGLQEIQQAMNVYPRERPLDRQECAVWQRSVVQQLVLIGKTGAAEPATLEVNETLGGMEGKIRQTLGPGQTLRFALQAGLCRIEAEQASFEENLLRVVGSARFAAAADGVVEISTTARDGGVRIAIGAEGSTDRPSLKSLSFRLVEAFVTRNGGRMMADGPAYLWSFPAAAEVRNQRAEMPALAAKSFS